MDFFTFMFLKCCWVTIDMGTLTNFLLQSYFHEIPLSSTFPDPASSGDAEDVILTGRHTEQVCNMCLFNLHCLFIGWWRISKDRITQHSPDHERPHPIPLFLADQDERKSVSEKYTQCGLASLCLSTNSPGPSYTAVHLERELEMEEDRLNGPDDHAEGVARQGQLPEVCSVHRQTLLSLFYPTILLLHTCSFWKHLYPSLSSPDSQVIFLCIP